MKTPIQVSVPSFTVVAVLLLSYGILFPSLAQASKGDQLIEFKECVKLCINENCNYSPAPLPLPLHLRLLFWTCPQECDYNCQRTVTSERIKQSLSIEQFHGKWPFRRVFGIQEPFSVLFSLLNLYAHVIGLRSLKRELPKSYPLHKYYRYFAYIGLICWFWSAVFHTRDFLVTERMDYFAAGANVVYGFFLAPVRIFRLYQWSNGNGRNLHDMSEKPASHPSSSSASSSNTAMKAWSLFCITIYTLHVSYLTFIRWSYTYNMAFNVAIGAVTNILWTYFSITYYLRLKRFWAAWPGLIVMWLIMAMNLELLDFPPIADALDAHSLWHAATVLPTIWWYKFLVKDARMDIEVGDSRRGLKE